ncbi:hypothetical protein N9D23_01855 [Rubripirellula sp.]|jgi:hypothetical protein|nr:hypothetical protein [Rubripirellula sp.]MDF1844323.1 hypothetical protein [Rubripirellula sp.]
MNETLDEHELQRLLDGSLTSEERLMLLSYAEKHPANWRRIAMAFIEEQVLRNELAKLPVTDMPFVENQQVALPDSLSVSIKDRHRLHWLAQAAAICLALGAAIWLGRFSTTQQAPVKPTPPEQFAENIRSPQTRNTTPVPSPDPSPRLVDRRNEMNLVKADNNAPVAEMFRPLFDQETLDVFRAHGYTVEEEPVIYVVPGHAGEQYFVPRRNVSFVAHRE